MFGRGVSPALLCPAAGLCTVRGFSTFPAVCAALGFADVPVGRAAVCPGFAGLAGVVPGLAVVAFLTGAAVVAAVVFAGLVPVGRVAVVFVGLVPVAGLVPVVAVVAGLAGLAAGFVPGWVAVVAGLVAPDAVFVTVVAGLVAVVAGFGVPVLAGTAAGAAFFCFFFFFCFAGVSPSSSVRRSGRKIIRIRIAPTEMAMYVPGGFWMKFAKYPSPGMVNTGVPMMFL